MHNLSATNQILRLFESGRIYLEQEGSSPVEIKRGMTILTRDGQKAGQVIAVILDNGCQQITQLLLTLGPQIPDYRLAPIDLIKQISQETILLHIDRKDLGHLPRRQEERS